jgi:hypothetical protein
MTRRPRSHLGWCPAILLPISLPIFLLAAVVTGEAQPRPLAVPERLPLRLEVTALRLDNATQAMVPVRADAPFKTGDVVAFDVKASRGGYLALLSSGTAGRLWPPEAAGHPMPSQAKVRVPASGRLRLSAPSPTKLSLVFSPRPLDGSAPPGSPAEKPRWLKQIILREVTLEPGEAGPALIFDGSLSEAEKAVIELELRHP